MPIEHRRPPVELVVLLASAGGLDALSVVLRALPPDLPAAVVVHQHLGGVTSVLPTILGRQTPHRFDWVQEGQAVAPGRVVVCPPGVHLELTTQGRCRLHLLESQPERRFDLLLASVASAYGARSVAVVLSGSGHDGAVGTVAMKRAGAIVLAQSPDTAQYPSMPLAAARAGADRVLPVHEIGAALVGLVAGAPLPEARGGDNDWATTPSAAVESRNCPVQPSSGRVENTAAARAQLARDRAAELRSRLRDLSAGFGATAASVTVARRRAEESMRRAQLARRAAQEAAARWGR